MLMYGPSDMLSDICRVKKVQDLFSLRALGVIHMDVEITENQKSAILNNGVCQQTGKFFEKLTER